MVRPDTWEVYKITCPYGVYIGVTTLRPSHRWYRHRARLREGKHPCKGLQRAFDEGAEISKPESLVKFNSVEKASGLMAERYYQLFYKHKGLLMNTRIEREQEIIKCKSGKKFLKQIKELERFLN